MTITNNLTNPLARMLDNAFTKFDADKNGKLNAEEYRSFYEILKPGIAVDENDKLSISEQEYRSRMDGDSDGGVSRTEVQGTGVLMPAELTGESLESMLQYLLTQTSASALAAANLLAKDEAEAEPEAAAQDKIQPAT